MKLLKIVIMPFKMIAIALVWLLLKLMYSAIRGNDAWIRSMN